MASEGWRAEVAARTAAEIRAGRFAVARAALEEGTWKAGFRFRPEIGVDACIHQVALDAGTAVRVNVYLKGKSIFEHVEPLMGFPSDFLKAQIMLVAC